MITPEYKNLTIKLSPEYRAVWEWYSGDTECAKRSGVPKINHVDEGLIILDDIGASFASKYAFCIHPLTQMDGDLIVNLDIVKSVTRPLALILAMEYRNKANAFLCRPETDHYTIEDMPTLPLGDVRDMLIADKVQNKKDFMIYHHGTHPRSEQLFHYFNLWLEYLGVDDEQYEHLIKIIG